MDYGDFDDPVPFSIKGCITIITLDLKKHFFHFGDDIKTKSAWLIAFDAAMDHYLFQKSLYSSPPHVELPSTLQFKMKKKFDKLFSLYRSIRDEDAILVFNECLLPTAEGTSSPSSLSATAGTVTAGKSSGLSPMDVTHYIQYEFYRRKDIKLQLHLQELAQYFIKNYPPKLPENDPTDANKNKTHPMAVTDSSNPVPQAPPLPSLPPEKHAPRPFSNHPPVKMKQFFWQKIKPINVRNTVWMSLEERQDIQWQKLEEKFGEKDVKRRRAIIKNSSHQNDGSHDKRTTTTTKLINLFDAQRTQNVAIACAKLKKTPEEIYDIVLDMDPLDLTLEVTEVILHLLLPTNEEMACLRAYTGPIEALDYCGQLFAYFAQIEGLESRLIVQKIMLSWSDDASYVLMLLEDVKKSLVEFKHECTLQPLQAVLAMVLSVGNYMNGSKRTGRAHGFKLTDLLKLKDIRETTLPQRNLLHFLVEQFPSPETSVFYGEWEVMWRVGKISAGNVEGIVKQLQEALEVCIAAITTAEDIQEVDIRTNLILRLSE